MHVRHLSVTDFRNWASAELPLEPGPSVLVGPNGQGKTNLMEAIGYLVGFSSHRVASDAPLVRQNCPRAIVRVAVVRDDRELLLEVEINPGKANRVRLNRAVVNRGRDALGLLRTVLFAPEDLALVRGDPTDRRRFLDDLLITTAPRYASVKADYERVLKQRNTLLKTAGSARRAGDLSTLDVWDRHLAKHGAELLAGRLRLVTSLTPLVQAAYAEVSQGNGQAAIRYVSSLNDAESVCADQVTVDMIEAALLAELATSRRKELERGITLVGPHRDDLALFLSDLPAKSHASHGESWSYALALKLACFELLRADGTDPVLILDDVFAELDVARRDRLALLASKAEQVLMTAAVPGDIPEVLRGARYDVADGEVRRVR